MGCKAMRSLAGRPDLCAINTATLGFQTAIDETIDAIAREGFGGIAPWRREVEDHDVAAIARRIKDAGLAVTGYCRSTFIPAPTRSVFNSNIESNRRAISDAATLGAQSFVMVVGGLPEGSKDIGASRAQVAEGIALLLEHARQLGVRLALEPLHPVYAAERSCLTLLSEATDLCEKLEPGQPADPLLGVCLDVYHVWWDPGLETQIARAGQSNRIFGFHVCDWLIPTTDTLNDRGMMGDGVIDIPRVRRNVEMAGYSGLVESEIFSVANWWKRPIAETLRVCKERFASAC
jgi:sugar phosphate isomerase/epimerase